jgi:hypothetical protein
VVISCQRQSYAVPHGLRWSGLWKGFERMEKVARANLHSFEEHTRGMKVLLFGNVAVVLAMSELLENGTDVSHDVSGYLLVKSNGHWAIVAHAWDQAGKDKPVPNDLR